MLRSAPIHPFKFFSFNAVNFPLLLSLASFCPLSVTLPPALSPFFFVDSSSTSVSIVCNIFVIDVLSFHFFCLQECRWVFFLYFSPRFFYSSLDLWLFLTNWPSIGSFGCMIWFCLSCTQENKKDPEVDQAQICLQSNLKVKLLNKIWGIEKF